jgi:hypothetical protein
MKAKPKNELEMLEVARRAYRELKEQEAFLEDNLSKIRSLIRKLTKSARAAGWDLK